MAKKNNIVLIVFLYILFGFLDAFAITPTETIKSSVDDIFVVLKDPQYKNRKNWIPLRKKIEKEVDTVFDFGEFSSRAVGVHWNTYTQDQKDKFNDAFSKLLLETYLNKVDGYNGEKVLYVSELISNSGDMAEVKTLLDLNNGRSISVTYRMLLKNKTWFVYDVIIENVSLVKNYRAQFQNLLIKGSPDELIQAIEKRAKQLRDAALSP